MTTFNSPHWLSDDQIAEIGIEKNHYEMYRRYHYQQAFGVGKWYDKLGDLTFRTTFVRLEPAEVAAILRVHSSIIRRDLLLRNSSINNDELSEIQVSSQDNDILATLERKIQSHIDGLDSDGVFIKLNTRSPKDVFINSTDDLYRVTTLMNSFETFLREERPNETLDTLERQFTSREVMGAFVKANTFCMRVVQASDAIDLLLESTRVAEDLSRVADFGLDKVVASVVVREWNENIVHRNHMEFRGFVYQNQLNAVSQYDDITFYPDIYSNKEDIGDRILEFFNEKIRDKLSSIESYVIDFFVDDNEIFVIELNPFHNGAGACLFSWRENRELFMNGPYEFRVVEASHPDPIQYLSSFWERKLKSYVHEDDLPVDRQALEEEDEDKRKNYIIFGLVGVCVVGALATYFAKNK
mmetsp:Transcript_11715/g.18454  ORF Transcript_11715/g.18454 Transcript_11715/m.18454 type:complete len:412 (+) Transcript_11715:29-1264(+)|eukprot:CAMPEP_0117021126 /NCGR_PEP_ID=MMETSP0472-20121206/15977_1 /TAXON_ID=693140 ORGANISM="Tiarina fusus, Strain LIS" /NCGR_SAMPLE_ID=MMETSP0472 /ASSEMBLY_ACC=CAM_ASM_000603 /LENGTH=411 /DNA_ID=CAMNT_0004726525 /DNA_START=12 /DNA_END=1247 /DNA_ORIENTATION=-